MAGRKHSSADIDERQVVDFVRVHSYRFLGMQGHSLRMANVRAGFSRDNDHFCLHVTLDDGTIHFGAMRAYLVGRDAVLYGERYAGAQAVKDFFTNGITAAPGEDSPFAFDRKQGDWREPERRVVLPIHEKRILDFLRGNPKQPTRVIARRLKIESALVDEVLKRLYEEKYIDENNVVTPAVE